MKIRTGFVSNSSSSSFILIGFNIPRDFISKEDFAIKTGLITEEEKQTIKDLESYIYNLVRNSNIQLLDHEEIGAAPGQSLIGKYVDFPSDELGTEVSEFNQKEILETAKKLGVKNPKIKIYYGVIRS